MTIFTDKTAALTALKGRFKAVPVLGSLCTFSDGILYAMLLAAEAQVAGELRTLLEPTQIFCADDDNTAAIAALPQGMPYIEDPGYDFQNNSFEDNNWSFQIVRRTPIIAIQSYRYSYYNATASIFEVPQTWLRIDQKYGHVRLLPDNVPTTIPLNAFVLSFLGNGRNLPNVIRITYTAGIRNIFTTYPDLVEFIYRMAIYNLILDQFPATSISDSTDGISQSTAFALKDYADSRSGSIAAERKRWQDRLNGVRITFA